MALANHHQTARPSSNAVPRTNSHHHVATGLATIGLAGVLFYAAAMIALHLARPDVDPIAEGISAYAHGPYGVVQRAAFVALGVGALAVSLALAGAAIPSRWVAVGALLVAVSGVCQVLLAVYPMDAPGRWTRSGEIHWRVGPIASVAMIAAVFALAAAFRRDERWRDLVRPSLVLGGLAGAGALATRVSQDYPELGLPVGLFMRIFVALLVVWWIVVAARLRTLGQADTAATAPHQASAGADGSGAAIDGIDTG